MMLPSQRAGLPVRFAQSGPSDAELLAAVLFGHPTSARALRDARRLLSMTGSLRALIDDLPSNASPTPQQGCSAIAPPETKTGQRLRSGAWQARLRAARELVLRSLHEELCERTTLGSPDQVRRFLRLWLRDQPREHFVGLFLDSQHRLIAAELLFQGTISQTAVYPREIVARALALNAAALIIAHNHPSGVTEPSPSDRLLTEGLKSTLRAVDVPVLDHLIVAGNYCYSFAEAGLI